MPAMPSSSVTAPDAPKVFISYSRKNATFAEQLVQALKRRSFEAYLDKKDIAPGEPWKERLGALIQAADSVVFVVSPEAVKSPVCGWEVEEAERLGKRILPVVFRTPGQKIPARLSRLNFIFFFDNSPFWRRSRLAAALKELETALNTDITWIREHTRLGELAARWVQSDKSADNILRGEALASAEAWITLRPSSAPLVTEVQSEYISQSRSTFDREQHEKLRQVERIFIGQSQLLARMATDSIRAGDVATGMLLALEALPSEDAERPYTPEPEAALYAALSELRERNVLAMHRGGVNRVCFSPDGAYVATASEDGTVWICDALSGASIRELNHGSNVSRVSFSRDGTLLATVSSDRKAHVWDTASGVKKTVVEGHSKGIMAASLSPDGARLITAGGFPMANSHCEDRLARVWSAETGEALAELTGHAGGLWHAEFSADGMRIVTASADKTARLWDASTFREIAVLHGHTKDVRVAAFRTDGARLVTASDEGIAKVWDADTGAELITLGSAVHGHQGMINSAAYSKDGQYILTAGFDGTARLWNASSGEELVKVQHDGAVWDALFGEDGAMFLTASSDMTARIWRLRDGTEVVRLRGHCDTIRCITISPTAALVGTASGDGTARTWRTDSPHDDLIYEREFDSAVESISMCSDEIHIWVELYLDGPKVIDARNWQLVEARQDFKPNAPDVTKGEIASGSLVLGATRVRANCASFGPDRNRVAIGLGDDNDDSDRDNSVRVLDATTGIALATFHGAKQMITDVLLVPSANLVIGASADGGVRAYRFYADTEKLITTCRTIVPRALTLKQRDAYYLEASPPRWQIEMKKWPVLADSVPN